MPWDISLRGLQAAGAAPFAQARGPCHSTAGLQGPVFRVSGLVRKGSGEGDRAYPEGLQVVPKHSGPLFANTHGARPVLSQRGCRDLNGSPRGQQENKRRNPFDLPMVTLTGEIGGQTRGTRAGLFGPALGRAMVWAVPPRH